MPIQPFGAVTDRRMEMGKYDEFRPGIYGTFREDGYRDAIKDLDPSPPDIGVLADENMEG